MLDSMPGLPLTANFQRKNLPKNHAGFRVPACELGVLDGVNQAKNWG
jgi:hypothetical protein